MTKKKGADQLCSNLVGVRPGVNPEDWFSRVMAQMNVLHSYGTTYQYRYYMLRYNVKGGQKCSFSVGGGGGNL